MKWDSMFADYYKKKGKDVLILLLLFELIC